MENAIAIHKIVRTLGKAAGKVVRVTVTDNSTSMINVRQTDNIVKIRLQKIFLEAPDEVLAELARFVTNKRTKTPLITRYIKDNLQRVPNKPPRRKAIYTAGKFYDLAEVYQTLNRDYFNGRIKTSITWGKSAPRYAVRKRILGNFNIRANTIRISPLLDKKNVPRYLVEYIVYHEMLHADMGVACVNGRRRIHTPAFKKREHLYVHYDKASAWRW